jgi:hypothetical protein
MDDRDNQIEPSEHQTLGLPLPSEAPRTGSGSAEESVGRGGTGRFQPGNELWKQRKTHGPTVLARRRRSVQASLLKCLSQQDVRDQYARLMEIIRGGNNKDAMMAFKAIWDVIGKPDPMEAKSGEGGGPTFVFQIPDHLPVSPGRRVVPNEAAE